MTAAARQCGGVRCHLARTPSARHLLPIAIEPISGDSLAELNATLLAAIPAAVSALAYLADAGQVDDDWMFAIPFLGLLYAKWSAPDAHYETDTSQVFQESVRTAVLDSVEVLTTAKRQRALTELERKPFSCAGCRRADLRGGPASDVCWPRKSRDPSIESSRSALVRIRCYCGRADTPEQERIMARSGSRPA